MNVYTLDAAIASSIILLTVLTVASLGALKTPSLEAPERELAELLKEPGFISAIYRRDARTVEAYLNSFLSVPYNFTVYNEGGARVLSVGTNVLGVAATAELPGWRGSSERLVVSLRVGV